RANKIWGNLHDFGSWDDPDAALEMYLDHKDALHACRKPHEDTAGLTVKELATRILNVKRAERGKLRLRFGTWLRVVGEHGVASSGKRFKPRRLMGRREGQALVVSRLVRSDPPGLSGAIILGIGVGCLRRDH